MMHVEVVMVNRILASLIVVLATSSQAAAQVDAPLNAPESMNLSGPRVGVTFLSDGVVQEPPRGHRHRHSTSARPSQQFGWQKEKRFYSGENGLTAVTEWVFLFGGFEQGLVIPSFSWLVGLRTIKGVEFAVGPNLSPAGAALAARPA